MADNSEFVLRWEIDNARDRITAGSGQSEVFNEGGFDWKVGFNRDKEYNFLFDFTLTCDHPEKGEWKCETDYEIKIGPIESQKLFIFTNEEKVHAVFFIDAALLEAYINNDKVIVEIRVKIISSEFQAPNHFEVPNAFSDVVLIVDGKKLHVNKGFLSVHSPVFGTMFNGNFVEKGKDEIEIKEVVYEEFVDLLNVIYPCRTPITASSVEYILKLADQFQMKDTREQAEKILMGTTSVTVEKKLILAEKYNIQKLMDHCLNSFNNNREILDSFADYDNFSDDLKKTIWKRMKYLKLNGHHEK